MTVSTSYAPIVSPGNGTAAAISVTWQFFSATLLVTETDADGIETVKTLTTHYTVAGGTDDDGLPQIGTVTPVATRASGTSWRIERVTPRTQASTWGESDAFPQKTVEALADRLTLIDQEADYVAGRAVKQSVADFLDQGALELPTPEAGAYLGWNADGDGLENKNGADFDITIGTVTTGDPGSSASATLSGTPTDRVLNLVIPRGDQGLSGSGSGDVLASSTFNADNAIIRADGTTKSVQGSAVAISDTTGTLYPITSDSGSLGSSTNMWSDVFLASGAVINFNNGNATVTHSAGLLTSSVPVSVGISNAITAGTIELGHASDTTLSRASAGNVAIEGNVIYRAGGTDVSLADGGTGASLADPGVDSIMFWDESGNAVTWLTIGTGLQITGTELSSTAGGAWEKIGSTTISSAVASVEQTFAAGAYRMVRAVCTDISPSTDANLVFTLRNASTAIVTLSLSDGGGGQFSSSAGIGTATAEFVIGADATTKRCVGEAFGSCSSTDSSVPVDYVSAGSGGGHATEADRVRVAYSSGNIDDGIITFYGLKV